MGSASIRWAGKALGGLLGFAAGGPVGSMLGALLGHQFDLGFGARFGAGTAARAPRQTQLLFLQVTFEVMGHVAKVDGRVSESEIRAARRIMHSMDLTPEQVRAAIEHFYAGKKPDYPAAQRLADLSRRIGGRRALARAFMEIQMQAAVAAGPLGQAKRATLWKIARGVEIGRVEFAQIEALIRAHEFSAARGRSESSPVGLGQAYEVLGVESGVADKDVKIAYRRLMNQHHPDKLLARGLPASMAGISERKTREIRAAYERIKAHRGFK